MTTALVIAALLWLSGCTQENSAHRRRTQGPVAAPGVERGRDGSPAGKAEENLAGPAAPVSARAPSTVRLGAGPRAVGFPAEVVAAEAALRRGQPDEAERLLQAAGGLDPASMERSWMWIELGLSRGRAVDVRRAADDLPEGDASAVLRAVARRDPVEREARVRHLRSGPASNWADLVRVLALVDQGGRSDAVRGLAARAVASGPAFVRREARLAAARDAIEDDRAGEALEILRAAHRDDPFDPRAASLASRAAARLGERDEAVRFALDAWKLVPRSGRHARRIADLLRDGVAAEVEEELRREVLVTLPASESAAGDDSLPSGYAEGLALLALLDERMGRSARAIGRYRTALELGCDPVPVDRHLRRLLFAAGSWAEGLEWLMRAVPEGAIEDAGNIVTPAWVGLRRLSERPPLQASAPWVRGELASLLVAVGALEEAIAVLADATDPVERTRRTRLRAEVAFHEAIRQAAEDGYRAPARGEPPASLSALVARIARAAHEHLPPDEAAALVPSDVGIRRVALLGAWLDHSASPSSPLVAHVRRFGRYLMIGQRSGKPAEAILFSMASLVPQQTVVTQGRSFRHDVAIGYDRAVRGYIDFQGGALAGAALPDGVWLDADATRREDHAIVAAVRSVDATLRARLAAHAAHPPEPDGPDGIFALDDPAGLWLRLASRYTIETRGARWGSFDVLRAHEFGHVIDLARHLPIARGLPATVALLTSEGFAIPRVEARLEGRAQLGAVIDAARPDLALMDLVARLPVLERSPPAHDRGYRDVVAAMLRQLEADPLRYPAIDRARRLLPQLDRLSLQELRDLARMVARSGWSSLSTHR